MDAANVDLKAFSEGFYKKLCFAELGPVLDTLCYLKRETSVWLEVTTLLIPGHNDSEAELAALSEWMMEQLGPDVPLHFTAFHPDFKLVDAPHTPAATLRRAREQALRAGLHHVYTGNVHDLEGQSTYCPACRATLIAREGYSVRAFAIEGGACARCASFGRRPLRSATRLVGRASRPHSGLRMTAQVQGVSCAVLMCHAPIVVPDIAGSRSGLCARTSDAMARAAQRLCAHDPDVLVVISPHAPRDRTRFGVVEDAVIAGDFGQFGWPGDWRRAAGCTTRGARPARGRAETRRAHARRPRRRARPRCARAADFLHAAGFHGATLCSPCPTPAPRPNRRWDARSQRWPTPRPARVRAGFGRHEPSSQPRIGSRVSSAGAAVRHALSRADRAGRARASGRDRRATARRRRRGCGRFGRGRGGERRLRAARPRAAGVRGAVRSRLSRGRAVRRAGASARASAGPHARSRGVGPARAAARHRARGDPGVSARASCTSRRACASRGSARAACS